MGARAGETRGGQDRGSRARGQRVRSRVGGRVAGDTGRASLPDGQEALAPHQGCQDPQGRHEGPAHPRGRVHGQGGHAAHSDARKGAAAREPPAHQLGGQEVLAVCGGHGAPFHRQRDALRSREPADLPVRGLGYGVVGVRLCEGPGRRDVQRVRAAAGREAHPQEVRELADHHRGRQRPLDQPPRRHAEPRRSPREKGSGGSGRGSRDPRLQGSVRTADRLQRPPLHGGPEGRQEVAGSCIGWVRCHPAGRCRAGRGSASGGSASRGSGSVDTRAVERAREPVGLDRKRDHCHDARAGGRVQQR